MPLRRLLLLLSSCLLPALAAAAEPAPAALPQRLSDTGLYAGAPGNGRLAGGVLAYAPQYALWSDGAAKRRWLKLPPGTAIDGADADAWRFPVGTRLWKEFSHDGRRIETRYLERRRAGWVYASYVWSADGSDALLAPAQGLRAFPVAQAPGGRYELPSRDDCLACHGGSAVPVLGVGALQLSPLRDADEDADADAAAPRLDSAELVRRGLLRGLPAAALAARIDAPTPAARAALGTLHANCGHCHHGGRDAAPVPLQLAQRVGAGGAARVLATTVDAPALLRSAALPGLTRIVVPGRPEASLLTARMRSRHAALQMPPLGTALPDSRGIAVVERWIADELPAAAPAVTAATSLDPQTHQEQAR